MVRCQVIRTMWISNEPIIYRPIDTRHSFSMELKYVSQESAGRREFWYARLLDRRRNEQRRDYQ